MTADLLAVLENATDLHHVARCHGGEYAGACPFCGGRDRFRAWPYADPPRWWCRRCWRKGDAIDFLRQYDRLDFRAARARLGLDSGSPRLGKRRTSVRTQADSAPSAFWQQRSRIFLRLAQDVLWSPAGREALHYLRDDRGLTEKTLRLWGLGYNPSDGWRDADEWGMSSEKSRVWLPAGIVIPCEVGREIWSIKVRRLEPSTRQRYVHVSGGHSALFGTTTLRAGTDPHQTAVLTEGEFDAMLLHQEAGDLVGAVTMGSAMTPLTAKWLWELRDARRVLVAYDADETGRRRGVATAALSGRMRIVRPIGGKDLTAMYRAGGDLRAWCIYHMRRCAGHEGNAAG